ncbi:GyrI-like domain-containing protein [Dysgonomonas termitidis]
MAAVEHFGTNGDKSPNEDFCCFCFQNGKYTDDFSFDEFVEDSLQYHDEAEKLDGHTLTLNEVSLKTRVKLPGLKRWQSHQFTHLEYYKSVNKAVDYINDNLSTVISLSGLAGIAGLSSFHFHRIFRAVMNENPGDYIQRLRLEKTAFKLHTTRLSLADIAEQAGYQSPQALSKAFKKRYGITPSAYRMQSDDLTVSMDSPVENLFLEPEIRKIASKEVFYLRVANPYKQADAFLKAWDKLVSIVGVNGIPDSNHEYLSLSRDISTITSPENCRIYTCINAESAVRPGGRLGRQTIEGGLYAVFTYRGTYKDMDKVYCNIYRYWIPKSEYELRDNMSFSKFLNSPVLVPESELLTEIYIPVSKI